MPLIKKIASLLAIFSVTSVNCQEYQNATVLVCYGDLNPDKIQQYKYVILESEHFNPFDVKLIRENNQQVLGYLSVGEVSQSRDYFDQIKDKTLGKNPLWDSYYLDLDDPKTRNLLMGLVDKIVKKGFTGLFLDTVDAYGPWGAHAEKTASYVSFLSEIKAKYPGLHLMQNAGLQIVPRAKDFINSIAIESVVTDYNFDKGDYRMRRTSESIERINDLTVVHNQFALPIILIEYADSQSMFNKVKSQAARLKWDYFIGNIELDRLPEYK
ncbi:endo alpha-1,4 polygalactosaminidase [Roseivirga sp.]|uniref:endo alpha-1,4 polygalactosaminidase n=1 Tax=Roseivirga sp. TaxID=1964215 RepID=UPI003B51E2E8